MKHICLSAVINSAVLLILRICHIKFISSFVSVRMYYFVNFIKGLFVKVLIPVRILIASNNDISDNCVSSLETLILSAMVIVL